MSVATVRYFVGDHAVPALPDLDRGLAYGDGLFETMRAHRGSLPWWSAHWSRLARGAARLRMALPDREQARKEAETLLAGGAGVVKLIVSRGAGGRGYGPGEASEPTWVLSRHAVPPAFPSDGLVLRWCETRLAIQPALAGLKHCNRLEQVLARLEWSDLPASQAGVHEGLMRSTEGDVVCATAGNVFLLKNGRWQTPAIDRCGVEGVCRNWAMDALKAAQARLTVEDIETADAIFLCNAVRGILPVAQLGTRAWSPHPEVATLQQRLGAEHPAFAATPTE